ncbi:MAG: hypothetical protein G8345_06715 [Magnetococcales bacterium]|nr:hypothetical protein [Magnetococcales bacterium]NGZ26563.1 hypothetical protein [Magnetococcales bacterium]
MSQINEADPSPTPEETSSQESPGVVRRRLLLKAAVVGIPAVVTLFSGRRAMAISTTDCIQALPQTGHGNDRCLTGGTDLGHDNFIEGSDFQYNNPSPGGPDNYLRRPETDTNFFNYDVSGNGAGSASRTDWCIVYVDGAGTVPLGGTYGGNGVSNAAPANGYYPMSRSCWGSIT